MDEEKDKKIYELALLLTSEDDLAGAMGLVRQHQGELLAEPRAKKLALAYKIKGNTEAVFVSVLFRALPEGAKNLEHDLIAKAGVIRSMILVAPSPSEQQPVLPSQFPMQRRGRPVTTRSISTADSRPAAPRPLSNEALEKKIEEILQ
jgi:ribosomal protein S6